MCPTSARARPTSVLVALLRTCGALLAALSLPGCLVDTDLWRTLRAELVDDDGDGLSERQGDCNDADPAVHPDQVDGCDGVDSDCNGIVDDVIDRTWWPDADRDGFGANVGAVIACQGPPEAVLDARDCDDTDPTASPAAEELCNARDDDCDGVVDNGQALQVWYRDADGDGYGVTDDTFAACGHPEGYVLAPDDCDDGDDGVRPGAVEVCGDGIDQDCDGTPSGCGWEDLTSLSAATVLPGDAGDAAGADLAVADIDLDGVADVLVGSSGGNVAWLVPGDRDGGRPSGGDLDAYAIAAVESPHADEWTTFGAAVAFCNFDAAGGPDLVVGSHDPSGLSTVQLWDAAARGTLDDEQDDVEWLGGLSDGFGADVACGAVDGDAYDDLVIGAPTRGGTGAVVVVSGPALGPGTTGWDTRETYTPPRVDLRGESANVELGAHLAVADVDGDGIADVLVGSPGDGTGGDQAGAIWVLHGPVQSGTLSDLGVKLVPPVAGGRAGPVAAGDLDGDGGVEIVVGAPDTDAGADDDVGAVYVLGGDHLAGGVVQLGAVGTTLRGDVRDLGFGAAVAVVGGRYGAGASLAVGAPGAFGGAGAVYLWDGATARETSAYASSAPAVFVGSTGDAAGSSIAAADLDHDGWSDLLVGAPGFDGGAGALYVVWGSGL